MGVNGEEKQEQQKTPEQLNKETFDKVQNEIKELTDAQKDDKDKIEGLDGKLTSGFFEHLKKPENNQGVKDLYDAAKGIQMEDTNTDKEILKTIITFIEPIANPINLGDSDVINNDNGTAEKFYNNVDQKKDDSINKINTLGGKINNSTDVNIIKIKTNIDNIKKILEAEKPTKEDVQSLQKLLKKNLNGDDLTNFEKSSFKNNEWDGKFGQGTMTALNLFLDKVDKYLIDHNKANVIASENDIKNLQAEDKKNEQIKQEKVKVEETNIDNEAKKGLDEAGLAGALTTKEVAELNDKTIKIDGDNVVYRGEKIPFADLGIARNKTNVMNVGGSGLANGEMEKNSIIENSDDLILSYLDGSIRVNSGTIGINNKDSGLIVKELELKKKEIDARVDIKLKNSVVYNEVTNNYEYKGTLKSRNNIGNGEGKISIQDFQNEVDKKLMSDNNEERSSTTQVSADQQTTRKVVDFVGDNGQKIVVEKQNDDGSSTKTVDAQRGKREKVVTTQTDSEGNIINKTKVKEDGDSFKEKARDRDLILKDKADQGKEFVSANADDIISAIKDNDIFRDLSINYNIQRDGDHGINIDIRKGYDGMVKGDFLKSFEGALKNKGIVNLDMKDYKFKGEKKGDKDIVTKLSFNVGEGTRKENLNPEFKKMDQIKSEGKWETINNGIQGFEYSKSNGQMFARTQDEKGNYQYQKYNQETNNRENQIDPYLRAGGDEQQSNNLA